ncbi:MAG: hypothetical protein EOO24_66280 [Comamonadaceae bacterium]|nr:MAG: hypothetical protein EOO24_66280 [Comamonadaceae bacterium]
MELRLQLLDSFSAQGSDGQRYKVLAYDRLAHVPGTVDQWEPTGTVEYRLDDSRGVDVAADGSLRIHGTQVMLRPSGTDTMPQKAALLQAAGTA